MTAPCNETYHTLKNDKLCQLDTQGQMGIVTCKGFVKSVNRFLQKNYSNCIKVELYSDEDLGRGHEDEKTERVEEGGPGQESESGGGYRELTNPEPMPSGATRLPNGKLKCDICGMICIGPNVLMVHKRSHTGERPFQCNQCGASFTQKGNLLRHIKLHSGEKPFKCPFCSYACRRRDALTGHLRTHAGKPYKCSYCGRSYKQQSTLEEHRERCHGYLQSLESQRNSLFVLCPGEEMRELEFVPDSLPQPSSDKMAFIDRLANSITKRKRSTPQKFVGEHLVSVWMAPHFTGLGGDYTTGVAGNKGGGCDKLRPLHLPTTHPCLTELRPIHSTTHTSVALGPRLDCTGAGLGAGGGREAAEGHEDLPAGRSHATSPSNGCQDSTDTESMPDELCNSTAPVPTLSRDRHSPSYAKDHEVEREDGGHSALPAPSSTSKEALRVVDGEGRAVRSFRCEHCRVLFLDHVMFTIHMGCHGFRQPFECNICGYRSQDRYEFSSHIVRGEHIID
uniref:IKAROS family zinc finger 4 n=1 Tax=Kryptolebias marmoratus TaxID=37003 RepID=A0A3Q3GSK9_KRYMA